MWIFHYLLLLFFSVNALGLGSLLECKDDSDCLSSDATCSEGICTCATGKVLGTTVEKCLDIVHEYGQPCEDDAQCSTLLGRYLCGDGKCTCGEGFNYINGQCKLSVPLGGACDNNDDCYNGYDLYSRICDETNKICTCREGYYNRYNLDCRFLATDEDNFCNINMDCQKLNGTTCNNNKCEGEPASTTTSKPNEEFYLNDDIPTDTEDTEKKYFDAKQPCNDDKDCVQTNSFCSALTKTCICQRGFYLNGVECKPELGTNFGCVPGSKDCGSSLYQCVAGACYCTLKFPYNTNERKCVKGSNWDTKSCTKDEGCRTFGPHASCIENKCHCHPGYAPDEHDWCIGLFCSKQEECSQFVNTECSQETGKCECIEHYHVVNGVCVRKLGAECSTTADCPIAHSICEKNCTCDYENNYYPVDDTACIKIVPLNGSCSEKQDCTNSDPNSDCNFSGMCECAEDFLEDEEICKPVMHFGSYCDRSDQCYLTLSNITECRNSMCACPIGYEKDGLYDCKPSAAISATPTSMIFYLIVSTFLAKLIL